MKIANPTALLDLVGQEFGTSDWLVVTQEQVNTFADATGDHQWIHVDPERAKAGPFGRTVAHGYLTLSLMPTFLTATVEIEELKAGLNYGLNKVRFPAPVPVLGRLRGHVSLAGAAAKDNGGVEATFAVSVELEGSPRPACVAEVIVLYM